MIKQKWTGKDVEGGYAQYTVVSEDFAYPIPGRFTDLQAAPLLCAGVIGYRALRLSGMQEGKVFVFTRPNQVEHQNLAWELGASWVGAT